MRSSSGTQTNGDLTYVDQRRGSATGMTLVVIGGILLVSQIVILLIFNIETYLTLPSLNPQSLSGSIFFGAETALGVLMITSSVIVSRPSASKSGIAYLPLASVAAIILLDEYMTVPAMGGPPTQILIQVFSIFVIPADNFIMGGGILLALAGSIVIATRFRKSISERYPKNG